MHKKIAIIVPVFNEERYLKKTLESISNQSYTNFDLIISDNHSTDSSREIIQNFISNEPRATVWCPPQHVPSLAHGQYLLARLTDISNLYFACIMLGGHDVLSINYAEALVKAYEKKPSAAVIVGTAYAMDQEDNVYGQYPDTPILRSPDRRFNPFSIIGSNEYNQAAFGLTPLHILDKVRVRNRCMACDQLLLAEMSLYGDIIVENSAKIYCRSTDDYGKVNAYMQKHLGKKLTAQETALDMDKQLHWLSKIASLAFGQFPIEMQNIYKASLMGMYFSRYGIAHLNSCEGAVEHWLGGQTGIALATSLANVGGNIQQLLDHAIDPSLQGTT